LTVGRLIPLKGFQELIQSWAMFSQKYPGNSLVIVGTGSEESKLKYLSRSLDLNNIYFEGAVDYDNIAQYYAAADVFIMPTLEDNWSLVVPEAMACGLPILCSIYNGCYPELVDEGENGWVFDPLDHENTMRQLLLCVENKEKLSMMGQKSLQIVTNYTPAHGAKAIYDACQIALKHRKKLL